ncbi:hypothetical protein [Candidatus Magnetaquicoccus inordinatus]|uniref:hypothetical protein n=1 Tax=Candidatus Magnetaquicoccus inordinatus TaxID=2496818 RepID=UPI00102CC4C4|nr:hypothetical protein [Candidatus Magnetaquicoccus inordinatus]
MVHSGTGFIPATIGLVLLLFSGTLGPLHAGELLYPQKDPAPTGRKPNQSDWIKLIREHISPLTQERGKRWPLVSFALIGSEPFTDDDLQMLSARGIAPFLPLSSDSIPAARRLQSSGVPVILFDGRNGSWPYSLESDSNNWAYQYPADLKVNPQWLEMPVPTLFRGWAVAAGQLRNTLKLFRREGITVDAIWLDYENEPSQADYYAAILSPFGRTFLPEKVLRDEKIFRHYCRQLWSQLLSSYIAGPAREIFPNVSITNWIVTFSSTELPVLGWQNEPHPPSGSTLFTTTNPVAYGIDTAFLALWKSSFPLDQEHVDQFYTHILLRQVTADSFNRQKQAPYLDAVPWVARWVADHPERKVPVMSRERYRETLRHLWMRGISGMQVFNPVNKPEHVGMAVAELQDAVAVYDEMLVYKNFLEKGVPMQLTIPEMQADGLLWSGLQLQNEAIVRMFWQGQHIGSLTIEPWPESRITLSPPTRGTTFHLRFNKEEKTVQIVSIKPS